MNHSEAPAILITGGSRGIGAATARLAAERGYDVCISYHSNTLAAERVCNSVRQLGRRCVAVQADLGHEADIVRLWQTAVEEIGTIRVLVNNVGILHQQSTLAEFEASRVEQVFRVNTVGSIVCAREAVQHMSTDRGGIGGVIVNVSSVAARLGAPNEYIDYAASKAAVDAMTIGLAKEVANEGIRVVGIRPGSTHTDIHASGGEPDRVARIAHAIPLKRGGQPEEIAEAIIWLASDQANYVTGSILDVTGGI